MKNVLTMTRLEWEQLPDVLKDEFPRAGGAMPYNTNYYECALLSAWQHMLPLNPCVWQGISKAFMDAAGAHSRSPMWGQCIVMDFIIR